MNQVTPSCAQQETLSTIAVDSNSRAREETPSSWSRWLDSRLTAQWIAAALVLLAIPCMLVDPWFAALFQRQAWPGELKIFLHRVEPFGHGYGVALIAATVVMLTQFRWCVFYGILACALGSGLAANLGKLFIKRVRPHSLPVDFNGNSFVGIRSLGQMFDFEHSMVSTMQSFPSAHTATAFGFAIALTALFPKARNWFFTLALLVGLQRVVHGSHHPSDVLIGAAVGLVAGSFLLHRVQQWGWIEPVVEQDQPLVSVPVSPLPVQQQPVPDQEIAKAS